MNISDLGAKPYKTFSCEADYIHTIHFYILGLMGIEAMDVDYVCEESKDLLRGLKEVELKRFLKAAAQSFFKQYGLISHQLNSYNKFIRNGIQEVFDSVGEIIVKPLHDSSQYGDGEWRSASVKFGKVTFEPPKFYAGEKFSTADGDCFVDMLPRHARLQNMTYGARMQVQVNFKVYNEKMVRSDNFENDEHQYIEKVLSSENCTEMIIGKLPVMVKSDLCWMKGVNKGDCDFDHGGYFIINGAEKIFVAQEQSCLKRLWLSCSPSWIASYRHTFIRKRVHVKLVDTSKFPQTVGRKVLSVFFLTEMPIWILFFVLGVSSDKEVVNLIDAEDDTVVNILRASMREADKQCENFVEVEWLLAYMVKCLLKAYTGRRKFDCRDDFRNKRLELANELLDRELRVHINHAKRRMIKVMQRDLDGDRTMNRIEHYLDCSIITNGLSRAFSTGAWSHPYKRAEKISGVVANLSRTNPLQSISEMRRTRQRVEYTGKIGGARYPHPSYWGKICFVSTPDGENCGLIKNLASTGLVSTSVLEPVIDKLLDCGMEELVDDTSTSLHGKNFIFLDGEVVGVCHDSASFVAKLRICDAKRNYQASKLVGICVSLHLSLCKCGVHQDCLSCQEYNENQINQQGRLWLGFQSLLDNGIIELIGAEEEEDCCTAWGIEYLRTENKGDLPMKYTHCELDMSFLLGLSCGLIHFENHNHAKRVLYQSQKHSHQAIGYSTTNPRIRVDTLTHQLYYPQKPLFRTMVFDCLGRPDCNEMPSRPEFCNGQCAIVAVNVHFGYNQEDSLVMNRASTERGMFRSEHIRSYKTDIYNEEAFSKPQKVEDLMKFGKIQSRVGRVDSLEEDGFPYIGASLRAGDIVIGKHADSGADQSLKLKHTERGTVHRVVLSANDEGKNFGLVSLRQVRSPSLGDKFSSMHGQKGVLGFLESQENFPFTAQGIVPDIVINPHAFPSRQTPGQVLEAALGKGIALKGIEKYATPFSTLSLDGIADQLHKAGLSRWGSERVYDGRTGEMICSLVFMGPTCYQRLNHMAEDKVKFRNTGPVHPLTRQPVADRKRFGGVKFGEMERDCLIAHGASENLQERLFLCSDYSQMHICRTCKHTANVIQRTMRGKHKVRGPYCRYCESAEDIVKVNVPYGAKLLCQELFSMGISLKFETKLW
ncbi:DNA-directed RNA polymerase subunit beta [Heracleum sosnowskyi]|uniref:DNA-directed RNA polymerase subunit beta n=1 Tax=Heracleum sosnowskyi TaxID=360622 RepID=A0AAD8MPU5_9APIA|nr:DNA-directed RNA polymerase subunit beta [Heracleum sosnowskyi]